MVFVLDWDESDSEPDVDQGSNHNNNNNSSRNRQVYTQVEDEEAVVALRYRCLHLVSDEHGLVVPPAQATQAKSDETSERSGASADEAKYTASATGLSNKIDRIVSSLAANLDLNTLHALSRTCRQFRATMLVYRDQLVSRSLRCVNEHDGAAVKENEEPQGEGLAGHASGRSQRAAAASRDPVRLTSGKTSQCARDMVSTCRKCDIVVCRNCTPKQPSSAALKHRHRRLCKTCLEAPLYLHTIPPAIAEAEDSLSGLYQPALSTSSQCTLPFPSSSSSSSLSSPPGSMMNSASLSCRPSSADTAPVPPARPVQGLEPEPEPEPEPEQDQVPPDAPRFTYYAFKRTPCVCPRTTYLCNPCARNMQSNDKAYARGWSWRTRYQRDYVGISDGPKGVRCGRRAACLASRLVQHGSDVVDLQALPHNSPGHFAAPGFDYALKLKHFVRLGALINDWCPPEHASADLIKCPETTGRLRSWCSWCDRVIPALDDGWRSEFDIGPH